MNSLPGQKSLFPKFMHAEFSDDRVYRYSLTRAWEPEGRLVNFIMLNPSTADEVNNDPTITRCIRYTDIWGYDGLVVTNIFALRSTDPKALKLLSDPVGPENDHFILKYAQQCDLVICAWGNHGTYKNRGRKVVKLMADNKVTLNCLSMTRSGEPGHPLYLKGSLTPQPYE